MTTEASARSSLGYCSHCGQPLAERPVHGRLRPQCTACGRTVFFDPKLAVAVVIGFGERILLQRRAIEPGKGQWTFPSGYVDRGEVIEAAAAREVQEEVRLAVQIDQLLGLYSAAGNPVALAVYTARPLTEHFAAGDEVDEVALFEPLPEALPPLAFPHDRRIIDDYRRLRQRPAGDL
jgi:ADP-ribose pyrophosphatase YjhB (NUDIX family)